MKKNAPYSPSLFSKKKIFFLVSLILTGIIFLKLFFNQASSPPPKFKGVLVEVEKARVGSIAQRITTNGVLVASNSVTITPESEGRVESLPFEQGQQVKKGDLLIKLEDLLPKAQVKEAEAKVAAARGEYDRVKRLFEKNFTSTAALEKTLAALKAQEAELDIAKLRLAQTEVRAPFDGVVGLKNVSVGAFITRNQELMTLVSFDSLYVDFSVPESYLRNLHLGEEIDVVVEGLDGLPVTGHLIAIDSKVDPSTHSIQARGQIDNDTGVLKPGQFGRVTLELTHLENVILVPEIAVEREDDGYHLFTVVDGFAVRTEVTVGAKDKGEIQIVHGVKEGDFIVTAGQIKLRDGIPVRIAPSSPAKPGDKSTKDQPQ